MGLGEKPVGQIAAPELDFGPHPASGRNCPSECEWKQGLNVTRKTKNRANDISIDNDSRLMEARVFPYFLILINVHGK